MTAGAVARVVAAAAPASHAAFIPASYPSSTQSAEARLPDAFAIFRTVNPFSAKHHPTSAAAAAEKSGPEASIILDGVAQTNNGWTAFFDSGKGSPVLTLSVGDPIARGHIQSVDLDSVLYVSDEGSQHVEVGQNLNGETPAPTSQPATPDKDQKPGRPRKGQPQNGQPQSGQPPNTPPPDGQLPQNQQLSNEGN